MHLTKPSQKRPQCLASLLSRAQYRKNSMWRSHNTPWHGPFSGTLASAFRTSPASRSLWRSRAPKVAPPVIRRVGGMGGWCFHPVSVGDLRGSAFPYKKPALQPNLPRRSTNFRPRHRFVAAHMNLNVPLATASSPPQLEGGDFSLPRPELISPPTHASTCIRKPQQLAGSNSVVIFPLYHPTLDES